MSSSLEGIWTIFYVYIIGLVYGIREKFWRRQKLDDIWRPSKGKSQPVAIVTGGTSGIGLQTTKLLLEQGFRVIVVARETGDEVEGLRRLPVGNQLDLRLVDLTSLTAVRKLSEKLLAELDKVHVLVCNAGVMLHPFALTEDGYETHMAVHVLAHALLVDRLTPLLQRARRLDHLGRVVNVTSSTLFAGRLRLEGFGKNYVNGYSAYADSKLALAVYSRLLQKHCNDSIEVVCLHPGVVPGHLYRYTVFPFKQLICGLMGRIWLRTALEAAHDVVYLCLKSQISAGCYFENGSVVDIPNFDERTANGLFERVQSVLSST
uniref:Uncharacterized protein n=1 Tax=Plectus sambesii TaxID=2011161 RepID=A0A914VGU2_9BILA